MVEIPPEDGLEQDKMTPVSISLCVLNGTGLKGAGGDRMEPVSGRERNPA